MLAPAATPAPALARLEEAACATAQMKARFQVYGMQGKAGSSAD